MPEKSGRYKIIFAICFFAIMLAFGCSSVIALNNNSSVSSAQADETNQTTEDSIKNKIINIWSLANNLTTSVDKSTSENSNLSMLARRLIRETDRFNGNDVVLNGTQPFVRLSNGYYTYIIPYSHSDNVMENILDFSDWLKERNIDLLTVIPANKSDDSITVFPLGVPHGYSQMEEEYKDFLDDNSLFYLNAKNFLLNKNSNFYDWFYKTDHHWNVHAGRLVAEEIAKTINDKFNLTTDFDAVRESNFNLTCYPESFIAAMGKKDGADKEDFEVLYPKEDGLFRIQNPDTGLDKTGVFADTLIDKNSLSENSCLYEAFLYGISGGLTRIENKNCENNTRVLVIGKSNANIVGPYLALSVRYLDIIDHRYYDKSILSFITETNPDIVVTCSGVPEGDKDDADFWKID